MIGGSSRASIAAHPDGGLSDGNKIAEQVSPTSYPGVSQKVLQIGNDFPTRMAHQLPCGCSTSEPRQHALPRPRLGARGLSFRNRTRCCIRGTALDLHPGWLVRGFQAPVQVDRERRPPRRPVADRPPAQRRARPDVDFRVNYRTVKTWFVDPVRRVAVPICATCRAHRHARRRPARWNCCSPARRRRCRVRRRPCSSRTPGCRSNIAAQPGRRLDRRSDAARRPGRSQSPLLAAQVVCRSPRSAWAGSSCSPTARRLLPDRLQPDPGRRRVADRRTRSDDGARPRRLQRPGAPAQRGQLDTALPGPIGNGEVAVQSAASSPDGSRVAVVATDGPRRPAAADRRCRGRCGPGRSGGRDDDPAVVDAQRIRGLDGPGRHERVGAAVLDADGNARARPGRREGLTGLGPSRTCACPATACAWRPWCAAALHRRAGPQPGRRRHGPQRPIGSAVGPRRRRRGGLAGARDDRGGEPPHGRPVSQVSVDGLTWDLLPGSNLTPPLRAVAAAPNRPVLVTDQSGVWSFAGGTSSPGAN